jgi:hypothetical protein
LDFVQNSSADFDLSAEFGHSVNVAALESGVRQLLLLLTPGTNSQGILNANAT